MATDFEKNKMISSGGFIPNATDTPIDVRTRIETIGDMETIPNPYVGMEVYVKDEQCHYKVLSLKSKTINGVEVANAVVDTSAKVVDLSGYLTESAAKGAYQPKGDYATVEALETAKSALTTDIDGVREYAEEVESAIEVAVSDHAKDSTAHITEAERTKWNAMSGSGDVDLSEYATKSEIAESYQPKGDYATVEALETAKSALTTDIDGVREYAEEVEGAIDVAVSDHAKDSTVHVTEAERTKWNAMSGSGDVDLSGYATKSEIAESYQPKGDYATVEALETAKSALTTDIDGVREYAEEVEGAIEVAVSDHAKDSTAHVTEAERTKWNAAAGVTYEYDESSGVLNIVTV